MINKGTENNVSEKFGFNLKTVFGINSPVNNIRIVEIIELSQNNQCLVIYHTSNKRFQYNRHLQTVDHQRYIVSDQHCRYKLMRVPVKYIQNLTRQAFFLFIKFET